MMIIWVVVAIGLILMLVMYYMLKTGDSILVQYSEIVGDKVIAHPQIYRASRNAKDNYIKISKINFKHINPPSRVMIPTKSGGEMVSIIKIDKNRYAYRLPTLHNEVFIPKRDENGSILKDKNGNPRLQKLKYTFTDNVIEPETVHWAEGEELKNDKRHKLQASFWEKYGHVLGLGVVAMVVIIGFNLNYKSFQETRASCKSEYDKYMEEAIQVKNEASRTQDNLNNLIEKVTGRRVFDEEESERQVYYNQTQT